MAHANKISLLTLDRLGDWSLCLVLRRFRIMPCSKWFLPPENISTRPDKDQEGQPQVRYLSYVRPSWEESEVGWKAKLSRNWEQSQEPIGLKCHTKSDALACLTSHDAIHVPVAANRIESTRTFPISDERDG